MKKNEDIRMAELIDHARAQWPEEVLSTVFQQPRYIEEILKISL